MYCNLCYNVFKTSNNKSVTPTCTAHCICPFVPSRSSPQTQRPDTKSVRPIKVTPVGYESGFGWKSKSKIDRPERKCGVNHSETLPSFQG